MEDLTAWKSMYIILSRATVRAVDTMIDAHILCEEIFMATDDYGGKDGERVLTDAKLQMVDARDALRKAQEAVKKAKTAIAKEELFGV